MPQTAIPMALLTFNPGVEAGQLAFVGALLLIYLVIRNVSFAKASWVRALPAYVIGGLACFWVIERTMGFWASDFDNY